MSVALIMNVHDGVILAADSASTLAIGPAPIAQPGGIPVHQVANVYNNANKIANLYKGKPIGCVTFGSGSIGNASISTLLKDFRKTLTDEKYFERSDYTVGETAKRLTAFLTDEYKKLALTDRESNLGIFLAGYSIDAPLGESWSISIQNGEAMQVVKLHEPEQVGINWGGEGGEAISRLVLGFSARLPQILGRLLRPPGASEHIMRALAPQLQASVLFAPMPIRDAIDLAEFLVHTAIQYSRFTPGAQVVGGPIEIAAITKHEGFKWIQRKHYYGVELNREVCK
jgi:hypothetical protein